MTRKPRPEAAPALRALPPRARGEGGFTVLELVVVLVMVGVLLGVGIPTFINWLQSGSNTTAQSNLLTALGTANTYYAEESNTYTDLCSDEHCAGPPAGGYAAVPGVSVTAVWGKLPSTSPQLVSIWTSPSGSEVIITALASDTHLCWGVIQTRSSNAVVGYTGPVTVRFVEKRSGSQKQPTCNAAAKVFTSAVPDLTDTSVNGSWPPAP